MEQLKLVFLKKITQFSVWVMEIFNDIVDLGDGRARMIIELKQSVLITVSVGHSFSLVIANAIFSESFFVALYTKVFF